MTIRKYVAGAALAGALGVGAVGLAGTASADYPKDKGGDTNNCVIVSCNTVTKTKTVTVTKTAQPVLVTVGQFGAGNVMQGAIASGIILNPQVNAGNTNTSGGVTNTSTSTQKKLWWGATSQSTTQSGSTGNASSDNLSSNSSSVNNAQGNGKDSSVNVGNN